MPWPVLEKWMIEHLKTAQWRNETEDRKDLASQIKTHAENALQILNQLHLDQQAKADATLYIYYMFVSACLTKEEVKELEAKWNKQGGSDAIPWCKFVMEHAELALEVRR